MVFDYSGQCFLAFPGRSLGTRRNSTLCVDELNSADIRLGIQEVVDVESRRRRRKIISLTVTLAAPSSMCWMSEATILWTAATL